MADIQKPFGTPKEEAALATAPEATTVDTATAPAIAETQPAGETKAIESVEAGGITETEPVVEAPKEDIKPVEEGQLGYKAQGLSFPKNLISSKEFFFFGSEPVDIKSLAAYQRSEKTIDVAHANIAWATQTGKGLLFVGEKAAPSHVINLSDATEPEVDGTIKFHFSAKGNKHTFKAANTAERDNWVSQLKLKIIEAKELATTVPETEAYKTTLESFKPTVTVAPKVEETPVVEETAAVSEPVAAMEAVPESPKEESKKDVEEPKRRSASRKRASFFSFGAKKESSKVDESPATETAPTNEAEVPKTEEIKSTEAAEVAPAVTGTEEVRPVEEPLATDETKPVIVKRNSIFGVFGRKDKKSTETNAADVKPIEAAETSKDEEPVVAPVTSSVAPVIPPVETTTPLAVEVSSPATVPTDTTPVKSSGDAVKEKRKSSLPFNFGRKSPGPVEGEEKSGSLSAFSKLRATINRKASAKGTETKEEEIKEEAPAVPAKEEPVTAAEPRVENKPESAAATIPVVTASA